MLASGLSTASVSGWNSTVLASGRDLSFGDEEEGVASLSCLAHCSSWCTLLKMVKKHCMVEMRRWQACSLLSKASPIMASSFTMDWQIAARAAPPLGKVVCEESSWIRGTKYLSQISWKQRRGQLKICMYVCMYVRINYAPSVRRLKTVTQCMYTLAQGKDCNLFRRDTGRSIIIRAYYVCMLYKVTSP